MPDILLRRFADVTCAMFFAFFGAMHDPSNCSTFARGRRFSEKRLPEKQLR